MNSNELTHAHTHRNIDSSGIFCNNFSQCHIQGTHFLNNIIFHSDRAIKAEKKRSGKTTKFTNKASNWSRRSLNRTTKQFQCENIWHFIEIEDLIHTDSRHNRSHFSRIFMCAFLNSRQHHNKFYSYIYCLFLFFSAFGCCCCCEAISGFFSADSF